VVEVPAHGLAQAGLEGLLRPPAELALDLARVDRVAPVVAGPVGDVRDEAAVRTGGSGRISSSRAQTVSTISTFGFSFQPPML
jgi:hypothetical protein